MRVALHAVGSGDALAGEVGQQLRAARRESVGTSAVLAAISDYVSGLVRAGVGMQGVCVDVCISVTPVDEPPPPADVVATEEEDVMAVERRKRQRIHLAA